MKKLDIRSYLIGALSITCVVLFMGQTGSTQIGNFDQIYANKIVLRTGGSMTSIIPEGVFIYDESSDMATAVGAGNILGSDYSFDKQYFGIGTYDDGGGYLQIFNQRSALLHEFTVSNLADGLYQTYDKYGNVAFQINGNGDYWSKSN